MQILHLPLGILLLTWKIKHVVLNLKNIFETVELDQNSVCRKFRRTAADGKEIIKRQFTTIKTTINDNSKIDFVWVGRATRRWQPKTKGFKAGSRLFSWRKVGLI